MKQFTYGITLLLISSIFISQMACTPEDDFITTGDAALEFSTDTLTFDTVFTAIGSATRILKIYNPHDKSIKVSKIQLDKGADSRFRINIDGISTLEASDLSLIHI